MTRIDRKVALDNRIQDLRHSKNLTQQELADAIAVTRATILALEKGSYNPSLELAFRLAKFFKTDVQTLFFEKRSAP